MWDKRLGSQRSRGPALVLLAILFLASFVPVAKGRSGSMQFRKIYFDPPGRDSASNEDLNAERVVIRNETSGDRRLEGWVLKDAGGENVYTFPDVTIHSGDSVIVHTGQGRQKPAACTVNGHRVCVTHLYWGLDAYVWDNDTDRAKLKSRSSNVVDRCGYSSTDESPKRC